MIIKPFFGGLGDSLQFSTLPRRYHDLGMPSYIYTDTNYRNRGIYELVWLHNPFIKGPSSEPPNAGDGAGIKYVNKGYGFIGNWEAAHGFDAPYSKYPEVYYEPKIIKFLKDMVVLDLSVISLQEEYDKFSIWRAVNKLTEGENTVALDFMQNLNRLEDYHGKVVNFNHPLVKTRVEDIFHYCDILHSCKRVICLFSGAQALISALQKYGEIDNTCLVVSHPKTRQAELTGLYWFDNINYVWI